MLSNSSAVHTVKIRTSKMTIFYFLLILLLPINNCKATTEAIETGIILLIDQVNGRCNFWEVNKGLWFWHNWKVFMNSLNLFMNLNCCLVQHNGRLLFEMNQTKVWSIFSLMKSSKKVLFLYLRVPHDITKDIWKNSHFENMTTGFLLRCQNSLWWEICLICHWNIDS